MALALGVGACGAPRLSGRSRTTCILQLIALRHPHAFRVLVYGYATLWFTTPFFAASMVGSLVAIVAYRYAPSRADAPAAALPGARRRGRRRSLVLGETPLRDRARAARPRRRG